MDNFSQFYKSLTHKASKTSKAQQCIEMMKNSFFKHLSEGEFAEKMKYYMRKLNISEAGPIPNSLLSRQDLAPTDRTEKTIADHANYAVWYYDNSGAQKCSVYGNLIDATAYANLVDMMGYKNVEIVKGQMEKAFGKAIDLVRIAGKYYVTSEGSMDAHPLEKGQIEKGASSDFDKIRCTICNKKVEDTKSDKLNHLKNDHDYSGKGGGNSDQYFSYISKGQIETTAQQINRIAQKAEEAETVSEKNTLVQNIKAVQLKRQKATIAEREKEETTKNFKDFWRSNNN